MGDNVLVKAIYIYIAFKRMSWVELLRLKHMLKVLLTCGVVSQ
jgi:hypothetical protein